MINLETLIKEDFQFYKGLGIAISLLLILAFQLLHPNRLAFRHMMRNWQVNIPMALVNTGLLSLLCGACVCTWAVAVRERGIGFFELAGFPYWTEAALTVFLLDFVAWTWHRANHVWGLLWRFHAVHHSDTHFDASTAFRFHPGELLISLVIRLLVVALSGLPILGLIIFEIVYGFFNLFVHSDIRLSEKLERLLGWVFVTPSLHRVHHSDLQREYHRNYGTIFSAWDRLARTYLYANANARIRVGLAERRGRAVRFREALTLPFRLY